jgi:hypothetical protein
MSDILESVLDAAATALGALNAALTLDVKGCKSWSIAIAAGLVGTVLFEATLDDANWFTVSVVNGAGASINNVVNPAGDIYSAPAYNPDWSQVRARVSAYTSGAGSARGRRRGG